MSNSKSSEYAGTQQLEELFKVGEESPVVLTFFESGFQHFMRFVESLDPLGQSVLVALQKNEEHFAKISTLPDERRNLQSGRFSCLFI